MILLQPTPTDAPAFVGLAQRLLGRVVALSDPAQVRVVQIDEWFDSKWLGFSGKLLGAVGVSRVELTVPPFHPNRVWAERAWRRSAPGQYGLAPDVPRLHLHQPSERNTVRRLGSVAPGALCFWYSAQSDPSNRGAMMCYAPTLEGYWSWYVALARAQSHWRVTRRRGLSPNELAILLDGEPLAPAV